MPTNYIHCNNCPYVQQQHLQNTNFQIPNPSPLSLDLGNNANTLLIFQAPGVDEWLGNTCSQIRIPIDSKNPHSAAARMKKSMNRKGAVRGDYDITEAVQCFPGKTSSGRDRKPSAQSIRCCLRHLVNDLSQKQYVDIVAFGVIAFEMAQEAVNIVNSNSQIKLIQPTPRFVKHPNGGIDNITLDSSY